MNCLFKFALVSVIGAHTSAFALCEPGGNTPNLNSLLIVGDAVSAGYMPLYSTGVAFQLQQRYSFGAVLKTSYGYNVTTAAAPHEIVQAKYGQLPWAGITPAQSGAYRYSKMVVMLGMTDVAVHVGDVGVDDAFAQSYADAIDSIVTDIYNGTPAACPLAILVVAPPFYNQATAARLSLLGPKLQQKVSARILAGKNIAYLDLYSRSVQLGYNCGTNPAIEGGRYPCVAGHIDMAQQIASKFSSMQ